MIQIVTQYQCDACKKSVCMTDTENGNIPSWTVKTEIGDLCPSCSKAWENYKQSFIEKMRIENKEALI